MGKKRYGIDEEKPVEVKGVNTTDVEPTVEPTTKVDLPAPDPIKEAFNKEFPPAYEFKTPKTQQEAFQMDLGRRAAAPSIGDIRGFSGVIDQEALDAIYAPVDLADGIPDYTEREKYKAYHGDKMVKLFDENTFGIKFQRDLQDLAIYKEKAYPVAVKRFIDELDENQSWYTWLGLTAAKGVGKVGTGVVGNLVGSIYGAFNGLLNWDATKVFDNGFFDTLDYIDQGVDKHLSIYGGSDVWDFEINPDTGIYEFNQKPFYARFWQDPVKSLNADVVPAAAFLADIVISESIATAITGATGGLGAPTMALNAARLTNKGQKLFSKMQKFGKTQRIIRGLDKLDNIKDAARIEKMAQSYRSGIGTVASMYRSASYESTLIARDTQEQTYETLVAQRVKYELDKLIENYKAENKEEPTYEELLKLQEQAENSLSEADIAKYRNASDEAGDLAFFMNIPLVGISNMIQLPRTLMKNYRVASANRGMFRNYELGGVRFKKGKFVANADANKYLKNLGYSYNLLKGPIVEGWEEFAQGAMQEGLVDYEAQLYSKEANKEGVDMWNSIVKKGQAYAGTIEGQDSMTIGALMGLLGIRVPVVVRNRNKKNGYSFRMQQFGGSRLAIKQQREKIKNAREVAKSLNDDSQFNPVLSENFQNTMRHIQLQKDMDAASDVGDAHTFKNKEFDSLFSLVHSRAKMGMGGTLFQELEALREQPVEIFNETYGTKTIDEYTEETKQEVIDKAQANIQNILQSIDDVEVLMNKMPPDLIQKAVRKVRGKKAPLVEEITRKAKEEESVEDIMIYNSVKNQMTYLHATIQNAKSREAKLMEEINDVSENNVSMSALDKVVAQIVGVNKETQKLEFRNLAQETKREILKDWKERDLNNYNEEIEGLKETIDDVLKLKVRRGEAAKMYKGLFTPQGVETFAEFINELRDASIQQQAEFLDEVIEENLKNSRNAGIEKEGVNEESLFGDSTKTDNYYNEHVVEGINEYDSIIADEGLSKENKQEAILDVLDKHPGLFAHLKNRLLSQGKADLSGIKVADQIIAEDVDGSITKAVYDELAILSKEVKERGKSEFRKETVDDADQIGQAHGPIEFDPKQIDAELRDGMFSFTGQTNNSFTIMPTQDKSLIKDEDGNWVTEKDEDGQAKEHPFKDDPYYPLDADKVNSPHFLNNQMLRDENHVFEFRVQRDNPYSEKEGITNDNIPIAVYHIHPETEEETFITRLPVYKEGKDARHLKALRDEIVRRDQGLTEEEVPEATKRIEEIKKEKASIKAQLAAKVKDETSAKTIDSRLEELKTEKESLQDKLDKSKNFEKRLELEKKLREVEQEIEYAQEEELTDPLEVAIRTLEKDLAFEKGEFGNPERAKLIETQIENLKKIPSSKKTAKEIIEENVTEDEIKTIAEEEGISEEEVRPAIEKEVLKQINDKTKTKPKTLLQRIAARIKKAFINLMLAATIFNALGTTFSTVTDGSKTYDNMSIESLEVFDNAFKDQEAINKEGNLNVITESFKDSDEHYLIIDKNGAVAHLFQGDSLVTTYEVGTGKTKGDAQTKTVIENGKVMWEEGNKQTGAGIYTIDSESVYKSSPSYTLKNERGISVPTALHETLSDRKKLFEDNNPENNRMSYGCVNFQAKSLKDLGKRGVIKKGSKVFILPDNPLNKFELVDGKVHFISNEENVNKTIVDYTPQDITIKATGVNDIGKEYLVALSDHKNTLMQMYPTVSNDIYNQITKIAYGIFGQESSFGTFGGVRGKLGQLKDEIGTELLGKENMSVGVTQIRMSAINEQTRKIFDIKKSSDVKDNIDKAAAATMSLLLDIYVNQIPTNLKEDFAQLLPLGYSNRTEFKKAVKGDKDTYKNTYIENVINNSEKVTIYLGQVTEDNLISPPVKTPLEKKSAGLILGLTLLGNLAAVRRKKEKGEELTEEDINSLEELRSEISTKINEIKTQEEEILTELKRIDNEIKSLQEESPKEIKKDLTFEEKIEELKKNKEFIVLSEDGKNYINTRTGKTYERVTNYIAEEEEETGDTALLKTAAALGIKVDELIRDFFAEELKEYSEYNLVSDTDVAIIESFIESLQKVKGAMSKRNETVIANGIILYNDELGIAGEVDLLTHDDKGVIRIYDMKTMRGNNFESHYPGETENKYDSTRYGKSKRQKHTEQLSMYRILLNNTHGLLADTIGIMPIEIQYNSGDTNTTKLNLLKGVELDKLDVIKQASLKAPITEESKEALKEKLNALNQELKGLSSQELDIPMDFKGENIFGALTDFDAIPTRGAKQRKEQMEQQIVAEYGQKNIDRARAINDNFDLIVKQVISSGINVFFDPNTDGKHEKC